jgi:hypothetical protein
MGGLLFDQRMRGLDQRGLSSLDARTFVKRDEKSGADAR